MAVRPVLARVLARLYPRSSDRAACERFIAEAIDDRARRRGAAGFLSLMALLARDIVSAHTGRAWLPVTAAATLRRDLHRSPYSWSLLMDRLFSDIRFAVRVLRRSPGFTVTALIVLALGIGATTAVYAVVDGVMLRPFPYKDMNRIAMLWETTVK